MARTLDTTTRQLQRIVALRYNPYFEQEVQKIRHKYKIPQDSEQARDWFKSLLKRYPRNTLTFYFKLWFRGKQHLLGLAAFALAARQVGVTRLDLSADSMASICDTEVPLEKDILMHLSRFKVPNERYPYAPLWANAILGDTKPIYLTRYWVGTFKERSCRNHMCSTGQGKNRFDYRPSCAAYGREG